MKLSEFVDRALDVPFVEKGRSFEGWDCWGLICVAYCELYGVELLSHTGEYSSTRRREELQTLITTRRELDGWVLHDPYEPGDVVLMKIMGRNCHTGLMLPNMWMLHVLDDVAAVVEQIDRAPWWTDQYNKIEGIYRHVRRV